MRVVCVLYVLCAAVCVMCVFVLTSEVIVLEGVRGPAASVTHTRPPPVLHTHPMDPYGSGGPEGIPSYSISLERERDHGMIRVILGITDAQLSRYRIHVCLHVCE